MLKQSKNDQNFYKSVGSSCIAADEEECEQVLVEEQSCISVEQTVLFVAPDSNSLVAESGDFFREM